MFWGLAFIVLVVFFIVVAVFWASCSPAKVCVFDPACCNTVCSRSCDNATYIPFGGRSPGADPIPPVALDASHYALFVIGATSPALGALTDLNADDGGEAAGFSAPFTSNGVVRDLTGYVQAKADSGTATVTLSLYVAPKATAAPVFVSVLSGSFTATTTQDYGYINQSLTSSAAAAVSAGDLYVVLVTASAPIQLYTAGGGFTYLF
jgi:hypothetical protein